MRGSWTFSESETLALAGPARFTLNLKPLIFFTASTTPGTIFCTLQAAVRQPASVGCTAAGLLRAPGGLGGLLAQPGRANDHSAPGPQSRAGSRFWSVAVFGQREACRLRRHHLLHSAGRRPAAGFGRLPGCCAPARRVRQLRRHHLYIWHSVGSPAAVWQPALVSCRDAAYVSLACLNDTIFCTLLCGLSSGSRLQSVAGLLRARGLPASMTQTLALCGPPSESGGLSGSRLRPVAGLLREGGSLALLIPSKEREQERKKEPEGGRASPSSL
jgi:hypothetical protein